MSDSNKSTVHITDLYPTMATYKVGDKVIVKLNIVSNNNNNIVKEIITKVYDLDLLINEMKTNVELMEGKNDIFIEMDVPKVANKGYGIEIEIDKKRATTSFDVLDHWSTRPRYGFLSDFRKEDEDDLLDIENLSKYHINVIQFYDWMYKHEDLIPKEDYYVDLLNRKLSKPAILNKIHTCHNKGIAALGYGAIYAASREFYESHKTWALYTNEDKPQNLGEWFYIMNIAKESPWFEHIINQFELAIKEFDFDGIHLDTYGFPKTAFSRLEGFKKLEKLNEQFCDVINSTNQRLKKIKSKSGVIFNAVSNWAVEEASQSDQAAIYIEVWDPQERYEHLYQLIRRAKELGHKQVILAAYLKCFDKKLDLTQNECLTSLLLTTAVIHASGGFHLALGENNGILCDPYYVNHGKLDEHSSEKVRAYYDFIVRYGELLFNLDNRDDTMTLTGGINTDITFNSGVFTPYIQPNKVWTSIKSNNKYKLINLVNLYGIHSDIWNESKPNRPIETDEIEVFALIDEEIVGVYYASPDYLDGHSISLEYNYEMTNRGKNIRFKIPPINIWSIVYVEVM